MAEQLVLGISLRDDATFDNFFVGDNQMLLAQLRNSSEQHRERFIYLWGQLGSGRSHLLQACCHNAKGLLCAYISFRQAAQFSPEMLEGLETLSLICLDDIECIAGDPVWEEALFHLYNRIRDARTQLIVASSTSPTQIPIALPDLRSRLAWGVVFQVQSLSDEEKIQALQLRAKQRGFDLSDDVGSYIVTHCARDMQNLYEVLEKLDHASLQAQRALTLPFVKDVLAA